MAQQQRYIKVLQQIKKEHADELDDELLKEIDNLLEAGETLPTLERTEKFLSIAANFLDIVENLRDWL